jgi:hypothetical protein
MIHAVKIPLERSDLFIHALNTDSMEIIYEVRDKETGKLMEPRRTSKLERNKDLLLFDMRHIHQELAGHIKDILT